MIHYCERVVQKMLKDDTRLLIELMIPQGGYSWKAFAKWLNNLGVLMPVLTIYTKQAFGVWSHPDQQCTLFRARVKAG